MNESEIKIKLSSLIKNIMNLDIVKLDLDRHLAEIDEWDSFNNLMLISEVEKTFGIRYTSQEISTITTINSIINSIKSKKSM